MDMYTLKQIPSETQVRKYLKTAIFGGKYPYCPECSKTNPTKYEVRYRCQRCKCKFSITSHTWLSNLKLPLTQWVDVVVVLDQSYTSQANHGSR